MPLTSLKTLKDVNVRQGQPSTTAPIAYKVLMGQTIQSSGYVTGENVSGNTQWYKITDGNYVWAGNVQVIIPPKKYLKVVKDVNIRQGQPSTTAPIVSKALAGQTIAYTDTVIGENVQGNTTWYKTPEGDYVWSGNVTILSTTPTPIGYTPITSAQLAAIVPIPSAKLTDFTTSLNAAMQEFSITTPLCQAAFIAQTAHESIGYSAFLENLNYSATALVNTWPTRFTPDTAALYAHQPQKIANHVYSNRNGNGDEASGDGWRYRGRGIIQITFKDNYRACGTALNLDLITSPELLEQSLHAFRSGAWFWNSRNLNALADQGDFVGVTKRINGGTNGLQDRTRYYLLAKGVLGVA